MNNIQLPVHQVIKLVKHFKKKMTTFTTEDVNALLTDWFPVEVDPVHEGEYDVMSTKWPWPHRAEWSRKNGWGSAIHVEQWRGLNEKPV